MKKLVIFLGFFIYCTICSSQEEGILNDTRYENASIYLSQIKIVSNKDYPVFLKDSINEFRKSLNKDDAEEIIRTSLVLDDNKIDNGLKINLQLKFIDNTDYRVKGQETITYHYENRQIFVPFSEIRFIRIRKLKDVTKHNVYYTVDFVTKVTLSRNSPYYGNNKFVFKIRPEANEVALTASLLNLCNNIKDSKSTNY
jgi:hypothetical protein